MKLKWRRYLGSLVDAILFIGIYIGIFFLTAGVILPNVPSYQKCYSNLTDILVESHLYYESRDGLKKISSTYESAEEALIYFYDQYAYEDNVNYYTSYDMARDKSKLFDVIDGVYTLKKSASDSQIEKFYDNEIEKAMNTLMNNSDYLEIYDTYQDYNFWSNLINIILISSIFYLFIPLFNNGRSIGRTIFKLELLVQNDDQGDVLASKVQILVRYIAFLMIVVLMSRWLFYIPLGINAIVYFIDKKARGLPDFFAVTYVKEREDVFYETERR